MPAPRDHVNEIKSRLDIVALISRYVALIPSGSGMKGRCPFHKDDTPSMTVSQEKGLWHCFGCGEGGDAIAFFMKIERLPFVDALRLLGEEVGVAVASAAPRIEDHLRRVLDDVAGVYAENLRSDAGRKARQALVDRGYPESCWSTYRLGYSLPGWDQIKRAFSRHGDEALVKLGLLVQGKKGTYDRFRDRIMFPILDTAGRPVGFGGRAMSGEPKYLNSPQTPLFDKGRLLYGLSWAKERMAQTRSAVLVEGYTDVLTLHQAQIHHAVGSMGTALTQAQADLLQRFVDDVVIAYDQDAAGDAATVRGMQILRSSGLGVRVASLPEGEDPDTLVRRHGAEAMQAMLDAALPFHDFYLAQLASRHDVSTVRGKERLLEETRPFYTGVDSAVLRQDIERKISELIGLSVESVRRELARRSSLRIDEVRSEREDPHWGVEEHLLALLLREEIRWQDISDHIGVDDFSEAHRAIATGLAAGLPASDLLTDLDEEGARRASFYALAPLRIDAATAVEDAKRWMGGLPRIARRLEALEQEIRAASQAQDWNRWESLLREKEELRMAWKQQRRGIHEQEQDDQTRGA
ncbi:MAG TPA: DNA primase [Candidatus Acetothermia bacterium]|nr:DNA primase [Candidatus Acetothermia bacterium]